MKKEIQCFKCGHKWKSRVVNPLTCPRCKRYDYWKKKINNITNKEVQS